jgi:hypothetical protein
MNRPKKEDIPKKSEMEFDTNPEANWLIGFTRDRNNTDSSYNNEMLYQTLWGTKRNLNEDINTAWVDVHTPEGELLKHTFDVNSFPHIVLVTPSGYYSMPWVKEGWTSSDVAFWADSGDYLKQDRNQVRPAVGATTLFLEYAIQEIATNHFESIIAHLKIANQMLETHVGTKYNFKAGYEHFGRKNKYRKQ